MTYKLMTLDGKYSRILSDDDFKTLIRLALKSGWQPSPQHVRNGTLHLEDGLTREEAKTLAAAIERSFSITDSLTPARVMVALETIGVLRHGAVRFLQVADPAS